MAWGNLVVVNCVRKERGGGFGFLWDRVVGIEEEGRGYLKFQGRDDMELVKHCFTRLWFHEFYFVTRNCYDRFSPKDSRQITRGNG